MLTSSRASTAASPSPYFLVTWLAEAAIPAPGSMLGWMLGEAGSWTVVCTRSPSAGRPGYAATGSTLEGAELSGMRADAAKPQGYPCIAVAGTVLQIQQRRRPAVAVGLVAVTAPDSGRRRRSGSACYSAVVRPLSPPQRTRLSARRTGTAGQRAPVGCPLR